MDNSVGPHHIYDKVKKLRPRFVCSVSRSFIKSEILEEEARLEKQTKSFRHLWRQVGSFLSLTDWIRFNELLGENGCHLRNKLLAKKG